MISEDIKVYDKDMKAVGLSAWQRWFPWERGLPNTALPPSDWDDFEGTEKLAEAIIRQTYQ